MKPDPETKKINGFDVTMEGTGGGLAIMLDGADAVMVTPVDRSTDASGSWATGDDGEPVYGTDAATKLYTFVVETLQAAGIKVAR